MQEDVLTYRVILTYTNTRTLMFNRCDNCNISYRTLFTKD